MTMDADDNATLVNEEKIYSNASVDDDFADDKVIIVMKHNASMEFKAYTVSDFPEINGENVTDLMSHKTLMAKAKAIGQNVLMADGTIVKSENDINVDTFNQIITITLEESGKDKVIEAIKLLESRDDILYVGPDYCISACTANSPTDPYNTEQWAIEKIELPDAWDITTGSSEVIIGVLDSGIDSTHPDLAGLIENSLCASFLGNEFASNNPSTDGNGHGTAVASIIAARGDSNGVRGVCWDATLVSLKVFDSSCSGNTSWLINAIDYAEMIGIDILNFSGGWNLSEVGFSDDDIPDIREAIEGFSGLFVCAAGNMGVNLDNDNDPQGYDEVYPAEIDADNIITVGASEEDDAPWNEDLHLANNYPYDVSNYGENTVDLFAPGRNLKCCQPSGEYGSFSGTSGAAPYVAGVAALILSEYPHITVADLKKTILDNVDLIDDLEGYCVTEGRLNAYNALSYVVCEDHGGMTEYLDSNSTYHWNECPTCGFTSERKLHNWTKYKNTGDTLVHIVSCEQCGASKTEGHFWVDRPNFGDKQCSKCYQLKNGFGPIIVGSIGNDEENE